MMSIKKTNQKGFSLVELLIVIAIMGVLAVIAFNAFNSVLQNSRRRADDQQAKNIERALQTLIAETGIPDILATGRLHTDEDLEDELDITADHDGIIELIVALQAPLYAQDRATGRTMEYGPYLANPQEDGTASFSSYAPQWNPEAGGEYVSYRIDINTSTQNVVVRPVLTDADDGDSDRNTYDEEDLGNHSEFEGIFINELDDDDD